jgi:hypothetical protein
MKTIALNPRLVWNIAYSPYVDTLHLYQSKISSMPDEELRESEIRNTTVVMHLVNDEPLLLELNEASRYLGEIDNMQKKDIIKALEGYINGKK